MIHIVFQHNDKEVLKEAIELDPALQGDIIQIQDEFAVGPIANIFSFEGIENRKHWWRDILSGADYQGIVDSGSATDDNATVASLKERLQNDPDESAWIWAAQNAHDVSGYYWLISQLKDFQGRIYILYLNNLPFISEKGNLFYPVSLFQIPPREFLKAKKLARPVSPSEFEVDPDEWLKLGNENTGVRILEGGKKLAQYDYDFFDKDLRTFITNDWQKANKIIHHYLAKTKHGAGDAFLLWRLKLIVQSGDAEMQGELKTLKDFEVKWKVIQPETGPVPA